MFNRVIKSVISTKRIAITYRAENYACFLKVWKLMSSNYFTSLSPELLRFIFDLKKILFFGKPCIMLSLTWQLWLEVTGVSAQGWTEYLVKTYENKSFALLKQCPTSASAWFIQHFKWNVSLFIAYILRKNKL